MEVLTYFVGFAVVAFAAFIIGRNRYVSLKERKLGFRGKGD